MGMRELVTLNDCLRYSPARRESDEINENSLSGLPGNDQVLARKIYCQVKSVELHVGYVHPSEPYIPPSQSIRYSPIQVTERKVEGDSLNETFVVPPSTKSVMIFMRQDATHVCIDRELDSKAEHMNPDSGSGQRLGNPIASRDMRHACPESPFTEYRLPHSTFNITV
eukprot:COSAG02_NODE_9535_length_2187_cov_1.823755_2_plen_168_part_00